MFPPRGVALAGNLWWGWAEEPLRHLEKTLTQRDAETGSWKWALKWGAQGIWTRPVLLLVHHTLCPTHTSVHRISSLKKKTPTFVSLSEKHVWIAQATSSLPSAWTIQKFRGNSRWSLGPSFLSQSASAPELTNFTAVGMAHFQLSSLEGKIHSFHGWEQLLSSFSMLGTKYCSQQGSQTQYSFISLCSYTIYLWPPHSCRFLLQQIHSHGHSHCYCYA